MFSARNISTTKIIKMYNIPGIITCVLVRATPGEYKDVDFELLQAKGWWTSNDNSLSSNIYGIMISCIVAAPFHMPTLLQWLLPIWRYKHCSLRCNKVLAAPPCSLFTHIVNKWTWVKFSYSTHKSKNFLTSKFLIQTFLKRKFP